MEFMVFVAGFLIALALTKGLSDIADAIRENGKGKNDE